MEINKHICFQTRNSSELIAYLRDNNIPFNEEEIVSSLDILESSEHWNYVSGYVQKNDLVCLSETKYTEEELQGAAWLRMRSQWRFSYPQPENAFAYEEITYMRDNHCAQCGSGLVQQNPFRIKKVPKWGKRFFAELNWIGDELFVNDKVKEIFLKHNVSGISFMDVLNKTGTDVFPGISQLIILNTLDNGLIANKSSIRICETCPICGVTKYVLSGIGMLSYRKEIFDNQPDIVKTGDLFGSMHYASRMILVRQKVYDIIVQNGLDRGLVFEPIELA